MPTKTRSPSLISRAATAIISSCGVYTSVALLAIVGRHRRPVTTDPDRLQIEPPQVAPPVGQAQHPLLQPGPKVAGLAGPSGVVPIGGGVALPEALERRGMAAAGLVDD